MRWLHLRMHACIVLRIWYASLALFGFFKKDLGSISLAWIDRSICEKRVLCTGRFFYTPNNNRRAHLMKWVQAGNDGSSCMCALQTRVVVRRSELRWPAVALSPSRWSADMYVRVANHDHTTKLPDAIHARTCGTPCLCLLALPAPSTFALFQQLLRSLTRKAVLFYLLFK